MFSNFEAYLAASFKGRAEGSWVAFVDGEEVAHDEDLRAVIRKVERECPDKTPMLAQVPTHETLIL